MKKTSHFSYFRVQVASNLLDMVIGHCSVEFNCIVSNPSEDGMENLDFPCDSCPCFVSEQFEPVKCTGNQQSG